MKKKTGRLSKIDIQYIVDNAHQKNYLQIASELGRDEHTVRDYIERKLNVKTSLATGSRPIIDNNASVKSEEFWPVIQKQFAEDELQMFEYYWEQIGTQFGHDVLPTEKLQIIDVIRFEILMDRNLKQTHDAVKNLSALEYQLQNERQKDFESSPGDGGQDPQLLIKLQTQITATRLSQNNLTKEFRELQEKKDKLLSSLRATRGDRIKHIENKKENFFTWLETLINDPDRRREMGTAMEKMRLSIIDEEIRLTAYHKYINGDLDQPLLTHETVSAINVEENNDK